MKNRPAYEHLLDATMSEDTYNVLLHDTTMYKKWTGPIAAYATAKVLRRPITIFSQNLKRLFMFHDDDHTSIPVCMHYRGLTTADPANHFVALLRRQNFTTIQCVTNDEYEQLREFGGRVPYV
jgi:hypothetical protein